MKISEYFVDKEQKVNGHIKGLIEDGSINELPYDAIADGYNIDFFNGYDKVRRPISLYKDLTTLINNNNGYALDNFYIKEFTDKTGTKTEVIIAGLKKGGETYKIYINKWYNPGNGYGNQCDGDIAWRDQWTEITEYAKYNVINLKEYGSYPAVFKEIWKIGINPTPGAENYYKGWFVYFTDGEHRSFQDRIIGVVVYSDNNNIWVRRATKSTDGSVYTGIVDEVIVGHNITLVRYPYVAQNRYENTQHPDKSYNNFKQINDIGFCELDNSVTITLGHEMRPLWFGFIPDRKYFGIVPDLNYVGAPANTQWQRNHDGFWLGPDIANVQGAGTILDYSTTAEVMDMRAETAELGVSISLPGDANGITPNLYAVSLQYDGYQAVRIKYIKANLSYIKILFRVDFDRRLTGALIFYNGVEDIFTNPYLLPPERGGITDIINKDAEEYLSENNNYSYQINGVSEADIQYGISINNYFNCTFGQQRINIKAKYIVKLENNFIAGNISSDSFAFSEKNKNYNLSKCIALSQIQNLNVSAYNVFGESRFTQPLREEITAIVAFNSIDLAIFTAKDMAIYELNNPYDFKIENKLELANKGTYNQVNVCLAQTDTYFGGIYWISKDGIYAFKNNNVVEITEGYFNRKEYRLLSEADKAKIKLCYKPSSNEIICYLDNDRIWVYEINYNRWKKYVYPEAINSIRTKLQTAKDGEIYISGDNMIAKTEKVGSIRYKDLQDETDILQTGQKIRCKIVKRFNAGTNLENLILHKIKLDIEGAEIPNNMGYAWGRDYVIGGQSGCSYQAATKTLVLNINGLWDNEYYIGANAYWLGQMITIKDLTDIEHIIYYNRPVDNVISPTTIIIKDDEGIIPNISENVIEVIIHFNATLPTANILVETNSNLGRDIYFTNNKIKKEIIMPVGCRKRVSYGEISISSNDNNIRDLKINEIQSTLKLSKDRKIII